MNRTLEYLISEQDNHIKMSAFLQKQGYSAKNLTSLRRTPDSFLLVRGGEILGKDREIHMNEYVYTGDKLTVFIRETERSEKILPVELPFPVIYEDEDLVVINKPAGMPIHPSIRHYENTLANAAAYYYREAGSNFVYRCINRLDKDTTGLTILAKNPLSGHLLQVQMRQNRIERIYTAIVEGEPVLAQGVVDLPIARKEESIIERIVDQEQGERAVTHYQVLRTSSVAAQRAKGTLPVAKEPSPPTSVVRLKLETGRTHQIRVHMKAIGHPLVGDYLYNPESTGMSRQALHAGELTFFQPITGEKIHLVTELPMDMQSFLQSNISEEN